MSSSNVNKAELQRFSSFKFVVTPQEQKENNEKRKKGKKKRKGEKTLRTRNFFLMKKIVDDPNADDSGGLVMVGTFVQECFDLTRDQVENDFHFKYRFNENSATDDTLVKRRTEPLEAKEVITHDDDTFKGQRMVLGTRTTFQAQIPLEVDTLFKAFPFHIVTATAAIELSSTFEGGERYRPDLFLHKKECRNNFAIQKLKPSLKKLLLFGLYNNSKNKMERILDKIDKSKKFDFISPYPKIYYEYDADKDYCPRYVVTFYCVTSGLHKFISIIFPMVLISFIATLNVMNEILVVHVDNESNDVMAHLQVTSALTLAAVFILPQIIDPSNRSSIFGQDSFYVIIVFVALVLTSIPEKMVQTVWYEIVGMVLLWISFLIPIVGSLRYLRIVRRIRNEMAIMGKHNRFLRAGKNYKEWSPKSGGRLDDLLTLDTLIDKLDNSPEDPLKDMYKSDNFRAEEFIQEEDETDTEEETEEFISKSLKTQNAKYRRIWYNTPRKKSK